MKIQNTKPRVNPCVKREIIFQLISKYKHMKILTFISVGILTSTLFVACNQKNTNDVPEAFQEKTVVSDISSLKRGNPDLISQLYSEILEKNKDLQALEDSISKLKTETSEKTEAINKFYENNQNFYNAAYDRIEIIQDSVIREKIFEKLSENENAYNAKTEKMTMLLGEISQRQAELNDYYTSLKILLSMKQNEKYQNKNMPDTNTITGLKAEYLNIIKSIQEKINK